MIKFINVLSKKDEYSLNIERIHIPQVTTNTIVASEEEDPYLFCELKVRLIRSDKVLTFIVPASSRFAYSGDKIEDLNVDSLIPVLVKESKRFPNPLDLCIELFSSKVSLNLKQDVLEVLSMSKFTLRKEHLKSYVYLGYSVLVDDLLYVEDVPYFILKD